MDITQKNDQSPLEKKGRGKKFSTEEDNIIRNAAIIGKTTDEIALFLGRTKESVDSRARKLGVKIRTYAKWTPKTVETVQNLVSMGKTITEISEFMGFSPASIRSTLWREVKKGNENK